MTGRKQRLLERLQQERERLLQALEGLSDDEMCLPNVAGVWSIKDVLGHIADWERRFVEEIIRIRDGIPLQPIPDSDIDAWNATQAAKKKDMPLQQIREEFSRVRQELVNTIESLPQRVLDRKVSVLGEERDIPWHVAAAWEHDQEHLPDILAWRRELGCTKA